jgi:hypothetical protein
VLIIAWKQVTSALKSIFSRAAHLSIYVFIISVSKFSKRSTTVFYAVDQPELTESLPKEQNTIWRVLLSAYAIIL